MFAKVGDWWSIAVSPIILATLAFYRRQDDHARMLAAEGLTSLRDLGETMMPMRYLRVLTLMADARGDPERATRLVAASDALLAAAGTPWPPTHRLYLERDLDELRTQLGEVRFVAAWTEGQRLTLDAALQEAFGPAIQ